MIARLAGMLAEKTPGRVIVDVQGVGYDVQVPLSTFYVVGEPGAAVTLRVHTHVREDVIALYGFATTLEQELFERLISISGIGPKLALAVLSGIEPPDLVRAIKAQDVARLTAIPGVGKKTAERIGLELKDRLPQSLQAAADSAEAAGSRKISCGPTCCRRSLNLGYQRVAGREGDRAASCSGRRTRRSRRRCARVLRALMK